MSEPILEIVGKSDAEIAQIFSQNSVALTPVEGRQIVDLLGRNPTLTEATIWGIQGSEHSSYKSSRKYLKLLPTKSENFLLGVGEDAGIVEFYKSEKGEKYGVIFAHESHNHPSQVVPFEGAATGIGGICRDVACMGGRVVGALDALRFGNIEKKETKKIMNGVVAGIGGYGNPLGVPNLGGDIRFDESFTENCLVNCVALGTVRERDILHSYAPLDAAEKNYEFILVGKATDRSGFGGSAFASASLNEDDREKNKGAVQEPNPFLERHILAALQDLFARLREINRLTEIGFKDLGAGGVLCGTIELVADQGLGAEVSLDAVHVAESNLPAAVIACAETQERFVFAVPPDLTAFFLEHFNERWDFPGVSALARASQIGKVVAHGRYTAFYRGEKVCDARAKDITEGIVVDRPLAEESKNLSSVIFPKDFRLADFAKKLLASENIASDRPFTESYDQTVQGNTQLTRDETDAVSFFPLADFSELSESEKKQIAVVSVAGPARIGRICAKTQSALAVTQAVLRLAVAGGKPLGLTDCLNYGNPENPAQMAEFAKGIDGIIESANALGLAFVSGNVSLYNATEKGSVAPSAIIGALGKIPSGISPRKNSFQKLGNFLVLLGKPDSALGGSEAARLLGQMGKNPPLLDFEETQKIIDFLTNPKNPIASSTLVTEGGVLSAILKMSARTRLGAHISASFSEREWLSEKPSVIVEITPDDFSALENFAKSQGIAFFLLGKIGSEKLEIEHLGSFDVAEISEIYWESLREKR